MKELSYDSKIVDEFYKIAMPICMKENVMLMNTFIQHGNTTCLEHCIAVAYGSFLIARQKGLNIDEKSLIRGALLHDYFLYDWHIINGSLHGYKHPYRALKNADRDFELTDIERNLILRHMFPLIPIPPKTMEGALVCLVDKSCSLRETLGRNTYKNHRIVREIVAQIEEKQKQLEENKKIEKEIYTKTKYIESNI